MNDVELKNMAEEIVKAEAIIQRSNDFSQVENAKKLIMQLASQITSLQEMDMLDDIIQEKLKKKFDL